MVDTGRHDRRSIRWQEHDYAAGGIYFVTVCTEGHVCLFGDVRDGQMRPNECGLIVEHEWMQSGVIRPEIAIDVFAVMPNHLHGLVAINPTVGAYGGTPTSDVTDGDQRREFTTTKRAYRCTPLRPPRSLGSMIAGFKQVTTMRINELRGTPGAKVWQRGFYDRVVRNDDEFDRIAWYIVTNPERWMDDPEHPW